MVLLAGEAAQGKVLVMDSRRWELPNAHVNSVRVGPLPVLRTWKSAGKGVPRKCWLALWVRPEASAVMNKVDP